jgi:hypothetical protein
VKQQYHRQITIEALSQFVAPADLETMIAANLGQDALRYQIGHDHYHYDNNSFKVADAYVEEQRQLAQMALQHADALSARQAFGRLTHTVQDFYAHSSYVSLWRQRAPLAGAQDIEPELPELLNDPRLCSGRLYYPLEALSFIPALNPLVLPLIPRDSHAWMNRDAPDRPDFEFAFAAAVKRTKAEYARTLAGLTIQQVESFTGIANR